MELVVNKIGDIQELVEPKTKNRFVINFSKD